MNISGCIRRLTHTGAMACGIAAAAAAGPVEVPLTYTLALPPITGPKIGSIRIAASDMTAPDAKPAAASLELGTTGSAQGILVSRVIGSIAGEAAGRGYRYNPEHGTNAYVVVHPVALGHPELFIAFDYFDDAPPGAKLKLGYRSTKSDQYDGRIDGPQFDGSNTWKTHQFHITDARFELQKNAGDPLDQMNFMLYTSPPPEGEKAPGGYGVAHISKSRPEDYPWKFPPAETTSAVYATFNLAGKPRVAVIDRSDPHQIPYNKLWFDANDDYDLTNDPVITVPIPDGPQAHSINFPTIATTVTVEGKALPYCFRPTVHGTSLLLLFEGGGEQMSMDPDNIGMMISTECYYRGSATIDGKRYAFILGDSDANGRFSGWATEQDGGYRGDLLSVGTSATQMRTGLVSSDIVIGDKLYLAEIREGEQKLILTRQAGPLNAVTLGAKVASLQVADVESKRLFFLVDPAAAVPLPSGNYEVQNYTMEKRDAEGDLWRINCGKGDSPPRLQVGAAPARLNLGEPFVARIVATINEPQRTEQQRNGGLMGWFFGNKDTATQATRSAALNFSMYDAAGRPVHEVSHIEGDRTKIARSSRSPSRPKEPRYKVTKLDGEAVGSGQFEYG